MLFTIFYPSNNVDSAIMVNNYHHLSYLTNEIDTIEFGGWEKLGINS